MADPTRVRLLALLDREQLTVAELAATTGLPQPRVSTHLAKLREAGLVVDRRSGVSAYYRLTGKTDGAFWELLSQRLEDPTLEEDAHRLPQVLAARADDERWADRVAGDMERHYSPGRTWEATGRALALLLDGGDVLDVASGDGVLTALLAPRARSITCLDSSEKVLKAARTRLQDANNVTVRQGDMHDLPFADASFDLTLLMHALTYADRPEQALREAARVLRPGGQLLLATLAEHGHHGVVAPFDHVNHGFACKQLAQWCQAAGLKVQHNAITSQEKRPPHFEVITLLAVKPDD